MATETITLIIEAKKRGEDAIRDTESFLDRIGGKAKTAGKLVAGGLGLAGTAFGVLSKKSVDVAGDFESAMNVLGVQAKSAGLSIDDLKEASLTLGGSTELVGINASQTADALTGLLKAGLTSTEIFGDFDAVLAGATPKVGAFRAAVDLQAASELNLAEASDLAAITLATFGGELETSEERAAFVTGALDNFVRSADASVAEVRGLADALKNVGPTAASFGFTLEETNNALAILSTRGIQGGEAGTALKSVFAKLLSGTKPVNEELTKLGVSLFDSEGNMKDLRTIIGELQGAMGGLTEEQRLMSIQTLSGTFGMKAMATLLEEGTEGWDAMTEAVAGASTMQEQMEARTQGLNAAMEAAGGVVETFMIRFGDRLLPLVTAGVDKFTEFVERGTEPAVAALDRALSVIDALSFGFENYGLSVEGVLGGLVEFDLITGQTADNIQSKLQPAIDLVVSAFEFAREHTDIFRGALKGVAALLAGGLGISLVVGLLGTLLSPLTLAAAAAAALGAAWETNFLGIRDITKSVIGAAKDFIVTTVGAIRQFWDENHEQIKAKAKAIWDSVSNLIDTVISTARTVIEVGITAAKEIWDQNHDEIKQIAETVWAIIEEVIDLATRAVRGIIEVFRGDSESEWSGLHDTLETVLKTAWDIYKTYIDTTINAILGILQAVLALIRGDWETAWEEVKSVGKTIWDGIKEIAQTIWEAGIRDLVVGAIQTMRDTWNEKLDEMRDKIDGIKDRLMSPFESIEGAIGGVIDKIGSLMDKIRDLRDVNLPSWLPGFSPPKMAQWFMAIGEAASGAGAMIGEFRSAVQSLDAGDVSMIADVIGRVAGDALGDVNVGEAFRAGGEGWGDAVRASVGDAVSDALQRGVGEGLDDVERSGITEELTLDAASAIAGQLRSIFELGELGIEQIQVAPGGFHNVGVWKTVDVFQENLDRAIVRIKEAIPQISEALAGIDQTAISIDWFLDPVSRLDELLRKMADDWPDLARQAVEGVQQAVARAEREIGSGIGDVGITMGVGAGVGDVGLGRAGGTGDVNVQIPPITVDVTGEPLPSPGFIERIGDAVKLEVEAALLRDLEAAGIIS